MRTAPIGVEPINAVVHNPVTRPRAGGTAMATGHLPDVLSYGFS
jgi:hypothetical protein